MKPRNESKHHFSGRGPRSTEDCQVEEVDRRRQDSNKRPSTPNILTSSLMAISFYKAPQAGYKKIIPLVIEKLAKQKLPIFVKSSLISLSSFSYHFFLMFSQMVFREIHQRYSKSSSETFYSILFWSCLIPSRLRESNHFLSSYNGLIQLKNLITILLVT